MSALADIAISYAALQAEVEPLLFLARDNGLQRNAIESIRRFQDRVDRERLVAIMAGDEPAANGLLGLREVCAALTSELQMYILLKEDQSEKAWVKLIDAQDCVSSAARASKTLTNLPAKFDRLRAMEKWFFPPQVFLSAGLIVHEQHCSICNDDYEKCDHLAGMPYMGRFCSILIKNAVPDHVAFVDSPADRRCRVISFAVPGGKRNRMTWVVTSESKNTKGNASGIVATSSYEENAN